MIGPMPNLSRRETLMRATGGFGALALQGLLSAETEQPTPTGFPARAKSVIYLYMEGGPSQIDTFDYKPSLDEFHGKFASRSRTAHRVQHWQYGHAVTVSLCSTWRVGRLGERDLPAPSQVCR